MNILAYASAKEGLSWRLRQALLSMGNLVEFRLFEQLEALVGPLRESRTAQDLLVLAASSRQELEAIVAIKDLTASQRIVLIAPDRAPETTHLAHQLYPRFLSAVDSDFSDVIAVVQRMAEQTHEEGTAIDDTNTAQA